MKVGQELQLKKVIAYICGKSIRLAALLIAISLLSFLLVSYSPIDPVQSYVGADMMRVGPEQQANIAEYWGLNEPKIEQFLKWGSSVLHGDLGTSLLYRSSVLEVIMERFLASLALMAAAWFIAGVAGFILGSLAGMYQGSWLDRLIKSYCFMLASTPSFWIGLLFLVLFSVWLGWFPVGLSTPAGILAEDVTIADRIKHLFLPVLTLSFVGVGNVALHTRQKLIEILESEYARFAKARGEQNLALFWHHGLRNVSLPAISLHFASFGELFGGAVLVEQVFSYPGLGQAIVRAGLGGDIPLLLGIVLFSSIFVFSGNLIADLLYRTIDPRIRKGGI